MIVAKGLGFRYANAARPSLQDVDLSVEKGECVLVTGPNGGGKSTLLRCLAGLVPQFYQGRTAGSLTIGGRDAFAAEPSEFFGVAALVGPSPTMQFFSSDLYRELAFGLESQGLAAPEIRRRVETAAAELGLSDDLGRPARFLSGGGQKLALLGCLLVLEPDCLLLDEPFSNLDPSYSDRVARLLQRKKEAGTTLVVSEHRFAPVWPWVDRVLFLDQHGCGVEVPKNEAHGHSFLRVGFESPKELFSRSTSMLVSYESGSSTPPIALWEGRRVTFGFPGRPILAQQDFVIESGERVVVEGSNGAGKTSFLKLLGGLHLPQTGELRFGGRKIPRRRARLATRIGYVAQNPDLQFFRLTAKEEIRAVPALNKALDEDWVSQLEEELLLKELAETPPHHLSEGQKRRLALGAALASRPEVLLLDEPTAGLDPWIRRVVGDVLARVASWGVGMVIATHDEGYRPFAHRVLHLEGTRLVPGDGETS